MDWLKVNNELNVKQEEKKEGRQKIFWNDNNHETVPPYRYGLTQWIIE